MAPVLADAHGGFLPSLALVTVAAWDGALPALDAALRAGGHDTLALPVRGDDGRITRAPVTRAALAERPWRVDFAGPPGTFVAFPSLPLVQMARSGVEPPADNPFRDRLVLVGATFAESRDFYPTPVGLMAGVEIQAHMINTVLTRRLTAPPHWAVNLALLAVVCVVIAVLALWLSTLWLTVASAGIVGGLAVASYAVYVRGGYWLDFVAPLAAMRVYFQVSKLVARRRLRAAFGQYTSPEVLERVVREGSQLGGEVRTVSVLMSDVRGFTTLSEGRPPAEVSAIMNEYFTAMVDVIMGQQGMVSDFIGDGILAIFGAPLDDPEHAWHAVQTALGMQAATARLNEGWTAAGRPSLAMGVAVNTGDVFAGNLGSPRKKKYGAIGDTVNTTARMEGLNRELGTGILISAATLALVKDRVVARDRGEVQVKGKAEAVAIFELEGLR
ncbi:MAG: adenylate/guanylate cyclase domain-containing protein, partial [Candidatus Rokubacteria bacterium]|nr:adenylate/guanylate cyclase domain-containing protein [Candidatus Rokubacteria bacterium]